MQIKCHAHCLPQRWRLSNRGESGGSSMTETQFCHMVSRSTLSLTPCDELIEKPISRSYLYFSAWNNYLNFRFKRLSTCSGGRSTRAGPMTMTLIRATAAKFCPFGTYSLSPMSCQLVHLFRLILQVDQKFISAAELVVSIKSKTMFLFGSLIKKIE